jgi:hypothetical protein
LPNRRWREKDLPIKYYRQLPSLLDGPFTATAGLRPGVRSSPMGMPLDLDWAIQLVHGYQAVAPLTMGSWALPCCAWALWKNLILLPPYYPGQISLEIIPLPDRTFE